MHRMSLVWVVAFVLGALTAVAGRGAAAKTTAPWTAGSPGVVGAIREQKAFVTVVIVPLCHNDQIDCGGTKAGEPRNLSHNLYWGAVFGQRRYFERKGSGWDKVATRAGEGAILEEVVLRRRLARGAFGADGDVDAMVVLRAYDGDQIDRAVTDYYDLATRGGSVRVPELGTEPLAVSLVGYAGHNRLMDGTKLPPAPEAKVRAHLPTFVFACFSESWFKERLVEGGARPVGLTRGLMAPEGYVVEAAIRALAEEKSIADVRRSVVAAYARLQRVEEKKIGYLFSKLEEDDVAR